METLTMNRSQFRCLHRLRVRWVEVDMQKIVFNGHYLMYVDTAVADYWRALALPYEASMHALGGDLYVKKASLEYMASARYDDLLEIGVRCARVGNSSIVFEAGVFRANQLLVKADLVYVFADVATQSSRPVPQALRTVFDDFEAGRAVTHLELGDWGQLGPDAGAVRAEVFVQEQGIPMEMEWDELDATAVHAVLRNGLGAAVATGRLLVHAPGVARVGRMAVSRVLRGTGMGQQVLRALVQEAQRRGDTQVILHAQRSAEGFYARAGFVPRGAEFEEAGIPHIEMVKHL